MNRTAMCIKMLQILKIRRCIIPKDELASLLGTKLRNIVEYRRYLADAGYTIEYLPGRYGGYFLRDDAIIPAAKLNEYEKRSLLSGLDYLQSHHDFVYIAEFKNSIEKVISSIEGVENINYVYIQNAMVKTSKDIINMTSMFEKAKSHQNSVSFEYASLKNNNVFSQRTIHPYDVINSDGQYYVVGYSTFNKAYRMYKISDMRMRSVKLNDERFTKDLCYKLSDHMGKKGVFKEEHQEVTLRIGGTLATYVAEHEIGINSTYEWDSQVLIFKTTFENEMSCDSFILSMGEQAMVIEPAFIRERISEKIKKMHKNYQNKKDECDISEIQ